MLVFLLVVLIASCGKAKDGNSIYDAEKTDKITVIDNISQEMFNADDEKDGETENLSEEKIQDVSTVEENTSQEVIEGKDAEEKTMKLYINDMEIPVIWENNDAVAELMTQVSNGEISVQMSMYSDNEQVGSLGKNYPSKDKKTTTHNGDIVLYNSSNIVVFYGSNTWSYTRLGKMNLSESEITELLSRGDVTLYLRK